MQAYGNEEKNTSDHRRERRSSKYSRIDISEDTNDESTDSTDDIGPVEDVMIRSHIRQISNTRDQYLYR
jgi:hypothetical protein